MKGNGKTRPIRPIRPNANLMWPSHPRPEPTSNPPLASSRLKLHVGNRGPKSSDVGVHGFVYGFVYSVDPEKKEAAGAGETLLYWIMSFSKYMDCPSRPVNGRSND